MRKMFITVVKEIYEIANKALKIYPQGFNGI